MGLFRFNYNKPGKGVDPNEPEKKGFFRYWEVVFEKFTKHLGLNCLYALISLPFLVILYLLAPVNPEWFSNILDTTDESALQSIAFGMRIMFTVLMFLLWGSGPATTVYAYVVRCFTNRTPVWMISDGFDAFKQNFKQSILVGIIDVAVLIFGINAIYFYYSMHAQTGQSIWMFICSLTVMMFIIFTWMQFYIYQLMVTFKLKFKELIKNSVLMAIAFLPFNVFFTVLNVAIVFGLFMFLDPMFAALILLVVGTLFTRLPIEFSAARRMRTLIANMEEKKPAPKVTYIDEGEQIEK